MDTLLEALRLHLLASLPQMFIGQLFIYSFLRPQPEKLLKRLAILSVIHSVYTDLFILYIPAYLQIVNSLFAMALLIVVLFKELPLRKKLFLFIGGTIFSMLMDMIITTIATAMGIEDLDSLQTLHATFKYKMG